MLTNKTKRSSDSARIANCSSFGILTGLLVFRCTFCASGCWLSFFAKGVIPFTEVALCLWIIDFEITAGEGQLVFHGQGV